MPRGPKGERRPADVVDFAVTVAKIATGEIEEEYAGRPRQPNKAEGGRVGGKARASFLTPERRNEIAIAAAAARWGNEG
ncbi:MAG: hypothetical protein OXC54_10435 [Rhodospirillaceae bacterium]|nr:hypothetical protein [Rhodospirillaceae bacterium]MCY4311706.1 hypothetical protein [Rhodospirillaceae bacterium]